MQPSASLRWLFRADSRSTVRFSFVRAFVRCAALVLVTVLAVPVQCVALLLRSRLADRLPIVWHRLSCALLDLDLRTVGTAKSEAPVLYICNHASYLDVTILGALLDAGFVAKSEVAGWPVIGFLCRLQDTIFIERRALSAREQQATLSQHLEGGKSLVLFPEGTSGDGNRVLPFKTALFAVAEAEFKGKPIKVQPITIAYSRLDGLAMGRTLRPYFTWYGDMTLIDHLWRCFGMGQLGVDVIFHKPVELPQFASRKALSEHCQARIANGLSVALAGRLPPAARPLRHRSPEPEAAALPEAALTFAPLLETGRDI